jgi:hypothetical protein
MKKQILTALALVCVGLSAITASATPAPAYTNINIQVWYVPGPSKLSPNYSLFKQALYFFLTTPSHPTGDRNTSPYAVTPRNMLQYGDIITSSTTNFTLWRGTLAPTGAFAQETGTIPYFPMRITSGQAFSPTWVWTSFNSADYASGALVDALAYTNSLVTNSLDSTSLLTWSTSLVGILWDGTNKTAFVYTNGPATNWVNEIDYVGVSRGFSCHDVNTFLIASNYVAHEYPFGVTGRYWIVDDSGNLLASGEKTVTEYASLDVVGDPTTDLYLEGQLNQSYTIQSVTNLTPLVNTNLPPTSPSYYYRPWTTYTNVQGDTEFTMKADPTIPDRFFRLVQ